MKKYKAYEKNQAKYSLYVHGYFIPWLEQQRRDGKLEKGENS